MNAGRFLAAAVATFLVRTVGNAIFYGQLMHGDYERVTAAHPDMFREVIPGFVTTDLIFAVVFTYLFVKVRGAWGGGVKAGVTLGIVVAILSAVCGDLYQYFSFTFMTMTMLVVDIAYQLVWHAVQGAVAGAVYKE